MMHMVIGMGEVGKAVFEVLSSFEDYVVGWHDIDKCHVPTRVRPRAMHICIPFKDRKVFEAIVRSYITIYNPELVIVHSSVEVGTCDANYWVHSPIRGVHPNIALGIRTFVKYFGGLRSDEAADIFSALGVRTVAVPHARDTEAAKLWDTTQYGLMILLEKVIYKYCKDNHLDFALVYTEFNRSYAEGYAALGRKEVARPYLKHMPGPIGGHCVMPNLPLLGDNEVTRLIKAFNEQLQVEDLAISGDLP